MSFKDRLAAMKTGWQENSKAPVFDKVPQGNYIAQLTNAELTESQSSQRMQIHREHVIMQGDIQGVTVHDYMQMETELGPSFIRGWLESLGFDFPADPSDLEETLAQLCDTRPICKIRVIHRGDFVNIRVNGLAEVDEADFVPAPAAQKPAQLAQAATRSPQALPAARKAADPNEALCEGICSAFGLAKAAGASAIDTVKGYSWNAADLNAEELAAVKAIGAEVSGDEAAVEEEVVDEVDPMLAPMLEFAEAQGIDVSDIDVASPEAVAARLNEYEWDSTQLTAEEVSLLEELGATVTKPAPKPAKRTAAKK